MVLMLGMALLQDKRNAQTRSPAPTRRSCTRHLLSVR